VSSSTDFVNLLITPPGDLLYFLAIFAISAAAFFVALGMRSRHSDARTAWIYVIGTGAVVAAWTALMVSALFTLVTPVDSRAILPPLDRLVQTLVIIALGWAMITANHLRFGRAAPIVTLVLVGWAAIGYIVTGIEWAGAFSTQEFNTFLYGRTWTLIPLAASAVGIVLSVIFWRIVRDSPLKIVFFGVLTAGYGLALASMMQVSVPGDYLGVTRIAFLAAMVLMLVIVYREAISIYEADAVPSVSPPGPVQATTPVAAPVVPVTPATAPVSERESAQLMKALGIMLEKASPDAIPERIVQASLNTLKAEVGALLTVSGTGYADMIVGHDRTMNRAINTLSINLSAQPTLANAIERRLQRPIYPDRNAEELNDLYPRLDIDRIGPTYFQPLLAEKELLAILMVGLPYSGRELTDAEQELLKGVGIIASNLLSLSNSARVSRIQAEARAIDALASGADVSDAPKESALRTFDELRAELNSARDQIQALRQQVTVLTIELDDERSKLARSLGDTHESQTISQRIVTLNTSHQKLIEERDRLAARLDEAEQALRESGGDQSGGVLNALIDVLRREKDDLVSQRDRLKSELNELRNAGPNPPTDLAVHAAIERMNDEKMRVEYERDALERRLSEVEVQLASLKVEASTNPATARQVVERELEREKMLQTLQTQVTNLASDREALTRQRDRLRSERDELLHRQESMRSLQARALAENAAFEQELVEAHQELAQARAAAEAFEKERSALIQERDRLNASKQVLENERDQLMARIEGDRDRLSQLGADGVGALTKLIEELTEQRAELERELAETKGKLATVEDKMEVMEIRAASLAPEVIYRSDDPDALIGMVQELRTPMTSITGYVDLLLNESAGILGEMQRKFLQRVSANVHRLSAMTDDLIQLAYMDAGKLTLKPELVNVVDLLDEAISNAAAPLREKGLSVHLNLDDEAPPVCADRAAIQQVIGQLLTNAYLASPPGTELSISARRRAMSRVINGQKESYEAVEITFSDSGGGIALEDQSRVFARKYRAENPLIQGLGDTGVGLAIARALVEANGGEIWVESNADRGSVFHFVLPAEAQPVAER